MAIRRCRDDRHRAALDISQVRIGAAGGAIDALFLGLVLGLATGGEWRDQNEDGGGESQHAERTFANGGRFPRSTEDNEYHETENGERKGDQRQHTQHVSC